jgi:hypothetical protein
MMYHISLFQNSIKKTLIIKVTVVKHYLVGITTPLKTQWVVSEVTKLMVQNKLIPKLNTVTLFNQRILKLILLQN